MTNIFYSFLLNKSKGSQTRTHLLLLVKKNKITNNVSIITKKEKNPNKQQNTNKTIRTIETNRYKKNTEIMVDSFYFILL